MAERKAKVNRDTLETQISVEVNIDGTGQSSFETGVPFLDHMLDQIARHGLMDLTVVANGDTEIDDHHTVEDIGITIGQAFKEAIGDKKRYTALWACLCSIGRSPLSCCSGFFWTPRIGDVCRFFSPQGRRF